MGKSAIARWGHNVLGAGPAAVVLLIAAAFSGDLHAASTVATSAAEVVAPIAVAQADIQLRFRSASGAARLTARTGETLIYTVIVRDLHELDAGGDAIGRTGKKTVSVTLAFD